MRLSKKFLKLSLTLAVLWAFAGSTVVLGDGGAPAGGAWEASLESARALQADRDYEGARAAYRAAQKEAGDREPLALVELARLESAFGQFDRAANAAREALDVAKSSDVRAAAGNELAVAILGVRKPSKKDLALAEETLRTAIDGEGEHRDYYALNLATVSTEAGAGRKRFRSGPAGDESQSRQ